jgi:hypothetical protein
MVLVRMIRGACLVGIAALGSWVALPAVTSAINVAGASPVPAEACATLHLSATPRVNAQNAPNETIKNTVTSCAAAPETVTLTQHISGPFTPVAASGASSRTWVLTLAPGQAELKVQHIPYSCCGTYTVRDQVVSSAGQLLAKRSVTFTFA